MLANLLHSIEWRHAEKSGASEVVVLVDDSFAEALKWNLDDAHVSPNYIVLPLAVDDSAAHQLGMSNASRFIVFTSKLSMSVALTISNMLQAVDATECCILSSASPESVEFTSFSGSKATSTPTNVGYQGLQDFLLPVKTRVTYFPLHTIHLLTSNPHDLSNQQVCDLHIHIHIQLLFVLLSSSFFTFLAGRCGCAGIALQPHRVSIDFVCCCPHFRGHAKQQNVRKVPPSQSSLVTNDLCILPGHIDFFCFHSVLDVNVSDLPDGVKTELKALAHDLAGALVFDYGMEICASFIFFFCLEHLFVLVSD